MTLDVIKLVDKVSDMYYDEILTDNDIKAFAFTMLQFHKMLSKETELEIAKEWINTVRSFDNIIKDGD